VDKHKIPKIVTCFRLTNEQINNPIIIGKTYDSCFRNLNCEKLVDSDRYDGNYDYEHPHTFIDKYFSSDSAIRIMSNFKNNGKLSYYIETETWKLAGLECNWEFVGLKKREDVEKCLTDIKIKFLPCLDLKKINLNSGGFYTYDSQKFSLTIDTITTFSYSTQ